ncbi:argininosuccinate synthetase [Bulinus truncatus]|nr:argininosuccinate synthetase [Bulinus truncatus]
MERKSVRPGTVGIIGVPFSLGQPKAGTEEGPRILRTGPLLDKLKQQDLQVEDGGDVHPDPSLKTKPSSPDAKNHPSVSDLNQKLSKKVQERLKKDRYVLVLGGDHSLGIGSIHGHAQVEPDLVVIWIDAHADINTPATSMSKNMHGMPLSFLVKELADQIAKDLIPWCIPCLSAKKLVYIALRDVDPGERQIIEQLGIKSFSMQEVDELGIKETIRQALSHIDPSGKAPIHVSLDVDGMDPLFTPSTGTAVPGGLTLREILFIAETISKTGRLSVLDVVEVNPKIGSKQEVEATVSNTTDVIASFFGRRREGNNRVNHTCG